MLCGLQILLTLAYTAVLFPILLHCYLGIYKYVRTTLRQLMHDETRGEEDGVVRRTNTQVVSNGARLKQQESRIAVSEGINTSTVMSSRCVAAYM